MMYKLIVLLLLFFGLSHNALTDSNIEEEVYVSLNGSTFISGESILYSVFVYAKNTGKPSPLSKVLYIELLNVEGKVAHQSKVRIEEGRGYGDIFIPSTFKTGAYRLVAYTRWMRNFDKIFNAPIAIVNPFESLDAKFLKRTAITEVDTEWKINFEVVGGGLVKGLVNSIGYSIDFPNDEVLAFKGKVLDDKGEKLVDFEGATSGEIRLTPNSVGSHRVILEDVNGDFHFFDLPTIVNQGTIIDRNDFGSFVVFSVQSTEILHQTDLVIIDEMGGHSTYPLTRERSVKVPMDQLSPGMNRILAQEDGRTLAKAKYYIKPQLISENRDSTFELYGNRELAMMSEVLPKGSYSISVKKKRDWIVDYRTSAVTYVQLFNKVADYTELGLNQYKELNYSEGEMARTLAMANNKEVELKDSISLLPELRGEIFTGVIVDHRNVPVSNKAIAYSTVNAYQLSLSKTNARGEFVFNVYSTNEDTKAFISVFDTMNYHVSIQNSIIKEHANYSEIEMKFDSASIATIVESSLHSQIENVYFEVKKDSSFDATTVNPLFYELEYNYELDDYNRFKTVKETITEYIPYLAVRKKDGQEYIKVRQEGVFSNSFKPLILLDGVPVFVKDVLGLSPYKIKSISGIPRRTYIGANIFDGVILFETKEGGMHGWSVNPSYFQYTVKGLEKAKEYKFPDYSESLLARIPDQREQLYWDPNASTVDGLLDFNFYTSDLEGEFELEINGFTNQGKPVYLSRIFQVE